MGLLKIVKVKLKEADKTALITFKNKHYKVKVIAYGHSHKDGWQIKTIQAISEVGKPIYKWKYLQDILDANHESDLETDTYRIMRAIDEMLHCCK